MNIQKLIIYDNDVLYDILNEVADLLNFSVTKISKNELFKLSKKKGTNFLIVNKKISKITNQIILNEKPFHISKLIQKLNIEFLKFKFNEQSKIKIKEYLFDLNAREMTCQDQKLKLTEKEMDSIKYLFYSKKIVKIQELQNKVWRYNFTAETHTVETHIYRLRKKIFKKFNDNKFIESFDGGYKIL